MDVISSLPNHVIQERTPKDRDVIRECTEIKRVVQANLLNVLITAVMRELVFVHLTVVVSCVFSRKRRFTG